MPHWLSSYSDGRRVSAAVGLRCLMTSVTHAATVLNSPEAVSRLLSGLTHDSPFTQLNAIDLAAVLLAWDPTHKVCDSSPPSSPSLPP